MQDNLERAIHDELRGRQPKDPTDLIPRIAKERATKEDAVRAAIWRLLDRDEIELTATWELRAKPRRRER